MDWFHDNVISLVLVCIVMLIFLALLTFRLALVYTEFKRELRQINNEILRTQGAEREYWIRRRRKLWLLWLPFVKY